jgi:hypothetical protein
MTFKEVYDKIIPHWGEFIKFDDGQIDPTDESYFFSNLFSEQWNRIEKEVGYSDPFQELMVWTMYQIFHGYCLQLFYEEEYFLTPSDIDEDEIEEMYFQNLNGKAWEKELVQYERNK